MRKKEIYTIGPSSKPSPKKNSAEKQPAPDQLPKIEKAQRPAPIQPLNADQVNKLREILTKFGLNEHTLTSDENRRRLLLLNESLIGVEILPTALQQTIEEAKKPHPNFPMLDAYSKLTRDNFNRGFKISPLEIAILIISYVFGGLATIPFAESSKVGANQIPAGPLTLFTSYGQQAVNEFLSQKSSIGYNTLLNGFFGRDVLYQILNWPLHLDFANNKEALQTFSPYSFEYMQHIKNKRNILNVAATLASTIPIVKLLVNFPMPSAVLQTIGLITVPPVFGSLHYSGAEYVNNFFLKPFETPYKKFKLNRLPPEIREHEIKKEVLEDKIKKLQAAFVGTLEGAFSRIENLLRVGERDKLKSLFEWLDKSDETTNLVAFLLQICTYAPVKEKDIPVNKVRETAANVADKVAKFVIAGLLSLRWQALSLGGYGLGTATGTVPTSRWFGRVPADITGAFAFVPFGGICAKGAINTGLGLVELGKTFGKGVYAYFKNDPTKEKIPIFPFPVGYGSLANGILVGGTLGSYALAWYSSGPSEEYNRTEYTHLFGNETGNAIYNFGDSRFGTAAGAAIFNGGPTLTVLIALINLYYIYYQKDKVFRDNIQLLNFIKDQISLSGRAQPKEFITLLQEFNKFQKESNAAAESENKKDSTKKPVEVDLPLLEIFFQGQQPEDILGDKYANAGWGDAINSLYTEYQKLEKEGKVLYQQQEAKKAAEPKRSWWSSIPRPSMPSFSMPSLPTFFSGKKSNQDGENEEVRLLSRKNKEEVRDYSSTSSTDSIDSNTDNNNSPVSNNH